MRVAALFLLLLSQAAYAAGTPRFAQVPGGEAAVDIEVDLSLLPAFTWAADPFLKSQAARRSLASVPEEEEFHLQAVTFEAEEPVAVVNDRVVRTGDRIGRRTVLKIGPTFVLLAERGSVIEAVLEEPKPDEQVPRAPAGAAGKATGQVFGSGEAAAAPPSPALKAGSLSSLGSASPVPANMRPTGNEAAMKAGQMLDKLLDGQVPDLKTGSGLIPGGSISNGTISIEEVKK